MATVVKFTQETYDCYTYHCDDCDDQSGEYVSLSDYNNDLETLKRELITMQNENEKLLKNRGIDNSVMTQAAQRMEEYRQEVKRLKSDHRHDLANVQQELIAAQEEIRRLKESLGLWTRWIIEINAILSSSMDRRF